MSVREWHGGKVALVWGGCPFLFALIGFLEEAGVGRAGIAWAIGAWLAYVLFCVVVTWVWFSGRERRRR